MYAYHIDTQRIIISNLTAREKIDHKTFNLTHR